MEWITPALEWAQQSHGYRVDAANWHVALALLFVGLVWPLVFGRAFRRRRVMPTGQTAADAAVMAMAENCIERLETITKGNRDILYALNRELITAVKVVSGKHEE